MKPGAQNQSTGKRGGSRPGAGRKASGRALVGKKINLSASEWAWLELWHPGNPSEQIREMLERARRFWPAGPARFR